MAARPPRRGKRRDGAAGGGAPAPAREHGRPVRAPRGAASLDGARDTPDPPRDDALADTLADDDDAAPASRPGPAGRRGRRGPEAPVAAGDGGLPSREALARYIRDSPGRIGKREIARAFRLGPEHRVALRGLLKSLSADGTVAPAGHRRFTPPGRLPEATIVTVTGTDPDGDPIARPVAWDGDGPPPLVHMHPEAPGRAALAPGERVLARLKPIGNGRYEGRTLKRLADAPPRVLGAFRREGAGGRLVPTDRRQKAEWVVPEGETGDADTDDLVLAEPLPRPAGRFLGLSPARVVEVLGKLGDARSVSLVAIATHGIPDVFPEAALAEAARARAAPLGKRADLRAVPLVTIDGADARDFDDAVHAEPDGDGFRLLVAIADVAHYVRPGSALDREALRRGNSVYFPDRVVPMLPEALSNGWCSLKPGEDRSCLYAELLIDRDGNKRAHRFGRGLMRSAARLTYEQVQAEADRDGDGSELGLPPGQLAILYAAFRALLGARTRRGTLDLDLPERKIALGPDGRVASVAPRPRLDSHRLIEEFMVLANVAAAEELERLRRACVYRVHAPPSDEKIASLRDFPFDARHHAQARRRDPAGRPRRHPGPRARHRGGAAGQRGDAAKPEPGRIQPRQHRPFRPGAPRLRAFHLADPPLRRPAGAPGADRRAQARTGRSRSRRRNALSRRGGADHRDRAAGRPRRT